MLVDHGRETERSAHQRRQRLQTAHVMGSFLANLANWSWFITITLRGDHRCSNPNDRSYSGRPINRYRARVRVQEFLQQVSAKVPGGIGWTLCEERGPSNNRPHFHLLISNTDGLDAQAWERDAAGRFGFVEVKPFDAGLGGAPFYLAKSVLRGGELDFGGRLRGVDLSRSKSTNAPYCGIELAPSVDLPRGFYHLGLRRWSRK